MKDSPYTIAASVVEEWCKYHYYSDMLVTLRLQDDDDTEPWETTEILELDLYAADGGLFTWLSDWWEGQKYVEVLGFLPVDELSFHNLEEMRARP